jgi:hypothetical protein
MHDTAVAHPLLIRLSRIHSQTSCNPNCRSKSRSAPRPPQTPAASSSLLIENASDQNLSSPKPLPVAFPIKASDFPGVDPKSTGRPEGARSP